MIHRDLIVLDHPKAVTFVKAARVIKGELYPPELQGARVGLLKSARDLLNKKGGGRIELTDGCGGQTRLELYANNDEALTQAKALVDVSYREYYLPKGHRVFKHTSTSFTNTLISVTEGVTALVAASCHLDLFEQRFREFGDARVTPALDDSGLGRITPIRPDTPTAVTAAPALSPIAQLFASDRFSTDVLCAAIAANNFRPFASVAAAEAACAAVAPAVAHQSAERRRVASGSGAAGGAVRRATIASGRQRAALFLLRQRLTVSKKKLRHQSDAVSRQRQRALTFRDRLVLTSQALRQERSLLIAATGDLLTARGAVGNLRRRCRLLGDRANRLSSSAVAARRLQWARCQSLRAVAAEQSGALLRSRRLVAILSRRCASNQRQLGEGASRLAEQRAALRGLRQRLQGAIVRAERQSLVNERLRASKRRLLARLAASQAVARRRERRVGRLQERLCRQTVALRTRDVLLQESSVALDESAASERRGRAVRHALRRENALLAAEQGDAKKRNAALRRELIATKATSQRRRRIIERLTRPADIQRRRSLSSMCRWLCQLVAASVSHLHQKVRSLFR